MATATSPDLNATDMTNDLSLSATSIVLVSLIYLPLTIITITGNIFVFVAYRRDERIRKRTTNTFILNLAIADLLVGLVMLINTPKYITGKWLFGRYFCITVWAIDFISTDMSVMTIVAITIDRYLMIRNAIKHQARLSRKRIAFIFSIVWILCSLVHLSIAFGYSDRTQYKYLMNGKCNLEYRRDIGLVSSLSLFEFVFPMSCLFLLNTKAFIHISERQGSKINVNKLLRKTVHSEVILGKDKASGLYYNKTNGVRLKSCRMLSKVDGSTIEITDGRTFEAETCQRSATTTTLKVGLQDARDNNMRVHRHSSSSGARNCKAAKLLSAVIIVFIVSWLPYFVYECYIIANGGKANDYITQTLTFILWANSGVNPMLYACSNVHYKNNFMYFLHLKKGERREQSNKQNPIWC